MDKAKRQRLEKKGWKLGSVQRFLGLTPAKTASIEWKVTLGKGSRRRQKRKTSRPS